MAKPARFAPRDVQGKSEWLHLVYVVLEPPRLRGAHGGVPDARSLRLRAHNMYMPDTRRLHVLDLTADTDGAQKE